MKKTIIIRTAIRCLGLFSLLVAAVSCAHFSRLTEVRRESSAPIPRVWLVKAVDLESRVPDPETEKKIPEIIGLLAGKYRVAVITDQTAVPAGTSFALCSIWIREQSFNRSLDQYNSIAGLLTLADPATGTIIARAVYAEESEESIRSFQRLYAVLDELVKSLTPSLAS
ncbi:MAG: hypothetical protein JXD23_11045 [Spirochaetales bacterium]|nr:hypothetical protein [Spirochaetales bacterium]